MSWQDDPVVGESAQSKPAWQSDPVVGAPPVTPPQIAQEDPGFWGAMKIGAGRMTDLLRKGATTQWLGGGMIPYQGQLATALAARSPIKEAATQRALADIQAKRSEIANSVASDTAEYKKLEQIRPWGTAFGEAAPIVAMSALFGPGASATYAGTGASAAIPATMVYGTPGQQLVRAPIAAGAAMGSRYVLGKAGDLLFGKPATPSVNPEREAAVATAQRRGIALPPSQVNPEHPGAANTALEAIGGEAKTLKAASLKAIPKVNEMVVEDLGLPPGTPLSVDAVEGVIAKSGAPYEAARNLGDIAMDPEFAKQMGKVTGKYVTMSSKFASRKIPEIDSIINDMKAYQSLDAGEVVEMIKDLRFDGFRNKALADPSKLRVGRMQVATADALDDLLERHAATVGQPELGAQLHAARTTIAKGYDVLRSMKSGDVVASKLAARYNQGKPLTGALRDIGQMAASFPRAFQPRTQASGAQISPLRAGAALLGGIRNPLASIPLLGPVARNVLLSNAWQDAMLPTVSPATHGLLGNLAGNPELAKQVLQSLAAGGGALAIGATQ